MDKFITTNLGGLPLRLNDYRFIDEAVRTSFKGIMSTYGISNSETIILSGCVRTVVASTVTVSSGYLAIGGEICFFPGASYALPAPNIEYWDVETTQFAPEGLKIFKNGNSYETYQKRVAVVKIAASLPSGFSSLITAKTVALRIRELLQLAVLPSVPISGLGFPSAVRVDNDGLAHFRGVANLIGISASNPITFAGAVPVGCRPSMGWPSITRVRSKYLTARDWIITIDTNGDMTFETDSAVALSDRVNIEGIVPYSTIGI